MILWQNCVVSLMKMKCIVYWSHCCVVRLSNLDYFRPDHDLKTFVLNCILSTLCWWHLRSRSPRVSPKKLLKVPRRLKGSLGSTSFTAPTPSLKEERILGRQQTQTEGFSSTIMERWQGVHGGPATEGPGIWCWWFMASPMTYLHWGLSGLGNTLNPLGG